MPVLGLNEGVREDRLLQRREEGLGARLPPPPARVHEDPALDHLDRRLEAPRLRRDELAASEAVGLAHAEVLGEGGVGAQDEGSQLPLRQAGQAAAIGLVQPDAAAVPALGEDRHARRGQGLDIAQYRSARHLELAGDELRPSSFPDSEG